jgi:hypothetical protein
MIRLYILAEGQTEERFVNEIVKPHLINYGCDTRTFCLNTSSSKKGGLLSYIQAKKHISRMLKSDNNPEVRLSTMFDLYMLPNDFPDYKEACKIISPIEKTLRLETAFAQDIDNPRFIPYLQIHEFEALIFADPIHLKAEYPDRDKDVAQLVSLSETIEPEMIDDGYETSPSHRIKRLIPFYSKKAAGISTLIRIGLPKLRERCPHFNEWLTKLEHLNS